MVDRRPGPHSRAHGLVVFGLLLVSLAACSPLPSPSGAAASPTAAASLAPVMSADDLAKSIRFRTAFGLRPDEGWIRSVAADPRSAEGMATYGVPLTPDEVANLVARIGASEDIAPVIQQYGSTVPDDWAGLFIDQQQGGIVVARFRANVDDHRRALSALLPADAGFDVRPSQWSDAELEAFIDVVEEDADWFPTIGTTFYAAEIIVTENIVRVRFIGIDPSAAADIEAHFGDPPWLRAVWEGPPPWEGPRGDLVVIVRDTNGKPVPDLFVTYTALNQAVPNDDPFPHYTDEDGRCLLESRPAGAYRVTIQQRAAASDDWILLGEKTALIPPDGEGTVRFEVRDR